MAVSLSIFAPAVPEGVLQRSGAVVRFAVQAWRDRRRRRRRASVRELNPYLLADLGLHRVDLPDGSSRIRPRPDFE